MYGVELEGGWQSDDGHIFSDGSVSFSVDCHSGEKHSPPFVTSKGLVTWMVRNYPQYTNKTCGLHLHISLPFSEYCKLMQVDFTKFMKERLLKWGSRKKIPSGSEFWVSLNGDNDYCKDEFLADSQAVDLDKHSIRYCQVNYCYSLHKTVEFRLLPMFIDADLSVKAVISLILIIRSWLKQQHDLKDVDEVIPVDLDEVDKIQILEEVI